MAQLSFILHKLINSNKKSRGGACHHEDGEKPSHAVHRGGAAKKEEGLMMAGGYFICASNKNEDVETVVYVAGMCGRGRTGGAGARAGVK